MSNLKGEKGNNYAPSLKISEEARKIMESVNTVVREVADKTSPGFSLVFLLLFACLAYLHERSTFYTYIVIALWLLLQSYSLVDEEFRKDLLWTVLGLARNVVYYLFLGKLWSMVKLYIDISQGNVSESVMKEISTCWSADVVDGGCAFKVVNLLKWDIVQWTTLWPLSLLRTCLQDPLRILTDLIFDWSRKRYAWIIGSAFSNYAASSGKGYESIAAFTSADMLVYLVYVAAYVLIGWIWSHVKLFIDISQKTLPPSLEREVGTQEARDDNYNSFLRKLKSLVFNWVIFWPVSLLETLFRHPLVFLWNSIYDFSRRKYAWIIQKALRAR